MTGPGRKRSKRYAPNRPVAVLPRYGTFPLFWLGGRLKYSGCRVGFAGRGAAGGAVPAGLAIHLDPHPQYGSPIQTSGAPSPTRSRFVAKNSDGLDGPALRAGRNDLFRGNALASLGVLQEDFDPKPVIHLLATPACDGRVLVDVDALLPVVLWQLPPVGQRACVIGGDALERLPVRSDKAECAVIENLHDDPALMHLAMVVAAELDEIGDLGFSSFRPVVDVMGIHVARVRATRESAAAIACVERAANRRWDTSRLASNIEWLALLVLQDVDNARIARQTTHRLHRQRRAVLELATSCAALAQGLGIHMNHNLLAVAAAQCLRTMLQETLRNPPQGIGTPGSPGRSLLGHGHGRAAGGLRAETSAETSLAIGLFTAASSALINRAPISAGTRP
jgi:hypothetical protein